MLYVYLRFNVLRHYISLKSGHIRGRYKSRTGLWSGSDRVGPSRIRSDQVGLGRIFRKFRNIRIFRECYLHKWKFEFFPALFTQRGKSAKWMATKVKHFMLLDF